MPLLLDLMQPFDESLVQVVESHVFDLLVFLVLDKFVFLVVNERLPVLLLLLLSLEEVRDEFVEPGILGLLDLLLLDLLLLVHELVVAVRLVDALVKPQLSEVLRAVQHVLVLVELPLQFFLLELVLLIVDDVRLVQHARVVRRSWAPTTTHTRCLRALLTL